eukprot:scaffold76225_cov42-Phaeocystis_antarctica.AAC.1
MPLAISINLPTTVPTPRDALPLTRGTAPPDPSLCHASTQHPRSLYKRGLGASNPGAPTSRGHLGPCMVFEFGLQGSPLTLVDVVSGLFRALKFPMHPSVGRNLRRSKSWAYRPRPTTN